MKDGKYSDIYFDSDEEEEEASRSGRRNVKSNDELLYDPEKDDEDQVDSFSLIWEYFFKVLCTRCGWMMSEDPINFLARWCDIPHLF